MKASEFTHLHLHTSYSLLDGAIRVQDLAKRAATLGMDTVAITDHGNMFGVIDFYQTMKSSGIKPIIGCEVYITPGDRREKKTAGKRKAHHLVLLAENNEGYKNLVRLVSRAYLEGFYYHPRIDWEILQEYHAGLIGLSACLAGEIPSAILDGELEKARDIAGRYVEVLGRGNFFLEVQRNGLKDQDIVNAELLKMSRELSIPLVATNDCHYLEPEDRRAHEVLLCIQTQTTIHDANRFKYESDSLYFRPGEEMVPLFEEFPGAITNTRAIAERCNVDIPLGKPILPTFHPPNGQSLDDYLDSLAREGLESRLEKLPYPVDRKRYEERLSEELDIIKRMGFSGYFLIVSDFVKFAHDNGIPVGPGRGSGAGSLVAYALRIIDLDPMRYNLLFERFLNPERVSMPDFDIDFCMNRREEVIQYVMEKYGKNHVGQIITFNSMKAKAVIRDVGRALDIPLSEVDKLAKLVPNDLKITLAKALERERRLKELIDSNPKYKELFDIARRLEGLNRHAGVHAAGIVISETPLWETVPVKREGESDIVTQYAKKEVENAGLVKFDFLGLKTLTVIAEAQKLVNKSRPPGAEPLDIQSVPLDDPKVYELIGSGKTFGVFQMESSGFQEMIKRMQPSRFEDIIAAVALYRPGPMDTIPDFVARKHGKQKISYPHPSLEPILKETYGLIVYQEQVMQISRVMAGFSMGYADILRRAMGKKDEKTMQKMRGVFIDGDPEKGIPGARKLGYDAALAESVFDLMFKFAEYGFNKSHAAGYAVLAYQTAWLKTHHPRELMAALMTCDYDKNDKVVKAINECRAMGIQVLPPDVNSSDVHFTVVPEGIRFGLAAVKNVGTQSVEAIIAAREAEGPFRSIFDFCKRVDFRAINKRVVENLIKCGAFDSITPQRSRLMYVLDSALSAGQKAQQDKLHGQANLFDVLADKGSEPMPEPQLPEVPDWPVSEKLACEKESLGFYITGHPLMRMKKELSLFTTHDSARLQSASDMEKVSIGGIVARVKKHTTKTKEQMAFITLEDLSGFCEIIVRPNLWEEKRDLLESDDPLIITGTPSVNESHIRLVAEDIMDMETARCKLTRGLTLRCHAPMVVEDAVEDLRRVIHRHPGQASLQMVVEFPPESGLERVVLDLGGDYRVEPTRQLIEDFTDLPFITAVDLR